MKKLCKSFFNQKAIFLLLAIVLSISPFWGHSSGDDADLDPVAFEFKSNKNHVRIGEVIELTIIARKRSGWDSRLSNTGLDTDFRIKVAFPDGFEQTGGN